MAPEWGRAVRPVVLVYTVISIGITLLFGADVNAQAGAYATGILAMMVSGAVAVTISAFRKGNQIAAAFSAVIVVVSLVSRVTRTTELRVEIIEFVYIDRPSATENIEHDG